MWHIGQYNTVVARFELPALRKDNLLQRIMQPDGALEAPAVFNRQGQLCCKRIGEGLKAMK